jgi:large subunit ribosomal protein L24
MATKKKYTYRGSSYTKFKKILLKKDDEVICISGKDKGKKGKILLIDKKRDRVIVTGLNKSRRAIKPTEDNPQGGIVLVERPMHISNIQFYDSSSKKGVRLGTKIKDGKTKVRIIKSKADKGKEV